MGSRPSVVVPGDRGWFVGSLGNVEVGLFNHLADELHVVGVVVRLPVCIRFIGKLIFNLLGQVQGLLGRIDES